MDMRYNLSEQPKLVDPSTEVGYLDDPRRELMRAIESTAPAVIESLRDEVLLPVVSSLAPPPPPSPPPTVLTFTAQPWRPEPPTQAPRIMGIPEVQPLIERWKLTWHLDRWEDFLAESRFNRLLSAVLEQWELGFFQEPKKRPMTPREGLRGVPFMEQTRWWYPSQDVDKLPWSGDERFNMLGVPPEAMLFWSQEYRNDVARRSMEDGRWSPQLDLVSLSDLLDAQKASIELRSREGLAVPEPSVEDPLSQMEPPPTLPIYDPTAPSAAGVAEWEERLRRIKQAYKRRVDEAFKAAGFVAKPRKVDVVNYERLVLHVVKGMSINQISEAHDRDRRQVSRSLAAMAERVGLCRPVEGDEKEDDRH